MNNRFAGTASVAVLAMALGATFVARGETTGEAAADPLFTTIQALDERVFEAFNRCADPGQLQAHASHFAEDVEFYHDNGGVTWTRAGMLENTRKYACGNYTRALVPGTLQVHPVRDFGAISQGVHRFCETGGDACDGLADFVMVWRLREGQWQITRVLSYGHRAADPAR